MYSDEMNQGIVRRLIILGFVLIILITAGAVYATSGNTFALVEAAASTRPPLTNPEILQNWLPASSYQYTIGRIDDYLAQNQLTASSMSVVGDISISPSSYNFTVSLAPGGQKLPVSVSVSNFDSIISTAVAINNQLQNPAVTPPAQGTPTITGLDDLINSGLTITEVNNLQIAFTKFAPSAQTIAINPDSITHAPLDPNSPNPTLGDTFAVTIDKTPYDARINLPDLDAVQLILTKDNKQVFDSGTVNSAN